MKNIQEIIKKEGDFFDWVYTAKNGLEVDCLIRRNNSLALCGYVVITSDNKLFGLDYDMIYSKLDVSVHGGLTYSDEGEGGGWVVGFDCAHAGDLCPGFNTFRDIGGIYRTKEYVIEECEKLAESISEFSGVVKRLKNIDSILGQ